MATFNGCIEDPRLLFFPELAVAVYWIANHKNLIGD
jgi:hypothetical protein